MCFLDAWLVNFVSFYFDFTLGFDSKHIGFDQMNRIVLCNDVCILLTEELLYMSNIFSIQASLWVSVFLYPSMFEHQSPLPFYVSFTELDLCSSSENFWKAKAISFSITTLNEGLSILTAVSATMTSFRVVLTLKSPNCWGYLTWSVQLLEVNCCFLFYQSKIKTQPNKQKTKKLRVVNFSSRLELT